MEDLMSMYRYVVGIGVPLALAMIGVLAKKVARRGRGWRRTDFYLGIELTLAGLANGLVSSCELLKVTTGTLPLHAARYAVASAAVTFFGFFILLYLLSIHQDWESNDTEPKRKLIWLGVVSNMLGLGTLIGSTVLIPGLG